MEQLLARLENIGSLFFEGMAEERFYDCFILMTERTSILHELSTKNMPIPFPVMQKIKAETMEMNILLEEIVQQKKELLEKEQYTSHARSSYASQSTFHPLAFVDYHEGGVKG